MDADKVRPKCTVETILVHSGDRSMPEAWGTILRVSCPDPQYQHMLGWLTVLPLSNDSQTSVSEPPEGPVTWTAGL